MSAGFTVVATYTETPAITASAAAATRYNRRFIVVVSRDDPNFRSRLRRRPHAAPRARRVLEQRRQSHARGRWHQFEHRRLGQHERRELGRTRQDDVRAG